MSTNTSDRRRFASAIALIATVAAILLGQVALSGTAQAAAPMAASAKVAAKAPTRIVLASRTYEMPRVPVTGTMYTRLGKVVPGARVEIYSRDLNSGVWHHIASVRTNAHGQFTAWVTGVTKSRYYQARFAATAKYSASKSNTARINATQLHTKVNATGARASVAFAAGEDIRGTLLDSHNRRLTGQRVEIWSKTTGAKAWTRTAVVTTNRSGNYVFTLRNLSISKDYQVRYQGAAIYTKAASKSFRTVVGKLSTSITAIPTATSIDYGYGIIVTGHLKDSRGTSVGGQRVTIYGIRAGSSTWAMLGTTTTSASGNYSFTTAAMTITTTLQARFAGADPRTGSASPAKVITVGAQQPVGTSIPPTTTPPVTTPPITTTPAGPATWVADPDLAAQVFAQINQYRIQTGVSPLTQMTGEMKDFTDTCVAKNTTGTLCDPYNLAVGALTSDEVMTGWKNSPEHNVAMIYGDWTTLSCAAFMMSDDSNAVVGCNFDF